VQDPVVPPEHIPVLVLQVSPLGHPAHVAPAAPHMVFVSLAYASHVVPLQQPLGHEVELHPTHLPAVHVVQVPHATQLTPPVPHVPVLEVSHCPLVLQQPLGHDAALHTHLFPLHASPCGHAVHALPAMPPVPH
jgi:hypothetical protein